ncbi:MAG: radical SAM protein [Deltaproteobacteria bacterium]|nr:radical SAM protein [Deltaproteobacteria bacterium]MBW2110729.1 radical SAM protein [Deltaproteobacteria bacterium]MBW2352207.1 radical SAM protein [Deltaproteobacteria bacterium]HDZ89857.1 radical SAM protein [Deltaproteobacteria bacterium]
MSWKIAHNIADILRKGGDNQGIDRDDALALMQLDVHSPEVSALMHTADRLSREQFNGKGENHFHIGINVEACPFNCSFCSLTVKADIFKEKVEFRDDEILRWAGLAESGGADALNLMTTGTYSFERLLEVGELLKNAVSTPLVANTRDINHREGEKLLDAGFVGAYHALRLGEGRDTPFKRDKRIHTIEVLKDVGLLWMNCVEPVGPEHAPEEIVDLMLLAKMYGATYSGVMRRINFPGSPMEHLGMVSELELARMVAVSRLVMADVPKAHCTHEPNSLSLIAGANLLFPEVGSSPRDNQPDTGKSRGSGILDARRMHRETGWDPGFSSNCFAMKTNGKRMSTQHAV